MAVLEGPIAPALCPGACPLASVPILPRKELRDAAGAIVALRVHSSRIRELRFERL